MAAKAAPNKSAAKAARRRNSKAAKQTAKKQATKKPAAKKPAPAKRWYKLIVPKNARHVWLELSEMPVGHYAIAVSKQVYELHLKDKENGYDVISFKINEKWSEIFKQHVETGK